MKYYVCYLASCKPFKSHPSRVRGLKYEGVRGVCEDGGSHPSRVRGLKFILISFAGHLCPVAPLAGAWIEIKVITAPL